MPAHRKPNSLKKLSGSKYVNENEPVFTPHLPPCPRWLNKAARAEWRRVSPLLARAGVLTDVDAAALQVYCVSYATWRAAEAEIEKAGLCIDGARTKRELVRNPYIMIANGAADRLLKVASEFGMTPASRGKLSVEPATDRRSLAEILFAGVSEDRKKFDKKTDGGGSATKEPGTP